MEEQGSTGSWASLGPLDITKRTGLGWTLMLDEKSVEREDGDWPTRRLLYDIVANVIRRGDEAGIDIPPRCFTSFTRNLALA